MVQWDWGMIKVGVLLIMYANAFGWMKKLSGSTFLGLILSSFIALIMWEHDILLYGSFAFLYGLGFWSQLSANLSERYVR